MIVAGVPLGAPTPYQGWGPQILPFIEPGHALAEVDLGPGDPTRSYSLGPAYGRILATKGGRLAYSFTDSPIYPMVIAQPYQWNEVPFMGKVVPPVGPLKDKRPRVKIGSHW